MKKLDVLDIVRDHVATLRDDVTGQVSKTDLSLFFGLPIAVGVILYYLSPPMPDGFVASIIALFSIFSALLFSAQIALYALKPERPAVRVDHIEQRLVEEKYQRHLLFLKDVNANTSYLILVSCLSLIIFVLGEASNASPRIVSSGLGFVCSHFFLSLLMLIRRTHIAFKLGYDIRD
jgi:hypothetical protein